MKKLVCFVAGCLWVSAVSAQFVGLPIAGGAAAPETGETRRSAGAVMGDDFNLYGGRLFFSPIRRLGLFVDAGAIDPDGGDVGFAGQGGALFALPLSESPVDVALRATWGHARFDIRGGDLKAYAFNAGAVVSREVEFLTPYAFLGLNFVDTEVKARGVKYSDDETDLAVAFGALLRLGARFSVYGELAHVDELFFSFGARWTL